MIDYGKARAWRSPAVRQAYTHKDCILYALGLGVGADPLDPAQLRFTYEQDLVALPTMAAVLASPGFWMRERRELCIDHTSLVHGEQRVVLHAALPAAATVVGHSRVLRIVDKGAGKGAVLHVAKELTDEVSGTLLASAEQVLFLRGDGGFSQHGGGDDAAAPLPPTPDRAPDLVLDLPTRRDAALLYRLSGDMNPLHADPAVAAKAGFPRPILHGLATYGMAGYGIVKALCDNDPARLRAISARLSSPVFPGETIRLEAWHVHADAVAFRARAVERDALVLTHGSASLEL